jgi:hypothetical protein
MCKFFSIIVIVFAALNLSAQKQAFIQTTTKAGKVTVKEIEAYIDSTSIYFEISATSHYVIGKRKSGEWAQIKDNEWGQVIDTYVNKDGYRLFIVSDKKFFYFKN